MNCQESCVDHDGLYIATLSSCTAACTLSMPVLNVCGKSVPHEV